MSIRVMICDDHPVVRDGLRLTLENSAKDIVVVANAADGRGVLQAAATGSIDVFIIDITMPNLNGIETTRALRAVRPKAKVIMLSLHDTEAMVVEALAAGAMGYLTKETATQNVIAAVLAVHGGHKYLCPEVVHYFMTFGTAGRRTRSPKPSTVVPLSGQQRRILQLIAEGHSTKDIATIMQLSVNTVHTHRNTLMVKLQLHKLADLVRYAIKTGIAKL